MVLASVWLMPACSDHDDMPGGENEKEHVSNPAGDDFYMYVNGEWHERLTDLSTPQGYSYDIAKLLAAKTLECYKTYEPAILIQESLANLLAGGQDANLQRVDEVIEELLADVETKTDAYRAIGKMVGMGLIDSKIRLYMYPNEGIMHYAVVPPQADEEGEEDDSEGHDHSLLYILLEYFDERPALCSQRFQRLLSHHRQPPAGRKPGRRCEEDQSGGALGQHARPHTR